MKNSILFTITMILLGTVLSCTQKDQTEKDIKMYTEVWDEVINDGKTELINSDHFTDDVTLITEPENVVGINALKSYWDAFLTGFSNVKFTINDVFGQNGNLVKHWHFNGKHTGDFFGIPASDNTVDLEGTTLIKMKNGKIAQEQDFFDVTNMMAQMGLDPNQANLAIIDQLYAHFNKGEIPAVLEMMAPNIVWNEATSSRYADGNPYTGPEAVLNGVFGKIGQDYDYFKVDNVQLTGLGDNKVLASLYYDFKLKNVTKGEKTSVVHEWIIGDEKITGFQQYIGLGRQ